MLYVRTEMVINQEKKARRAGLKTMMPGYEYAFSPTHCLQDNSPVENVVRMYECALKYGTY